MLQQLCSLCTNFQSPQYLALLRSFKFSWSLTVNQKSFVLFEVWEPLTYFFFENFENLSFILYVCHKHHSIAASQHHRPLYRRTIRTITLQHTCSAALQYACRNSSVQYNIIAALSGPSRFFISFLTWMGLKSIEFVEVEEIPGIYIWRCQKYFIYLSRVVGVTLRKNWFTNIIIIKLSSSGPGSGRVKVRRGSGRSKSGLSHVNLKTWTKT